MNIKHTITHGLLPLFLLFLGVLTCHAEDTKYELIRKESQLSAGDEIILVYRKTDATTNETSYHVMTGYNSSNYFESEEVQLNEDQTISLTDNVTRLVLERYQYTSSKSYWRFKDFDNQNSYIDAMGKGKMRWVNYTKVYISTCAPISIDQNGVATITLAPEGNKRIIHYTSGHFTCTEGITPNIYIYRKVTLPTALSINEKGDDIASVISDNDSRTVSITLERTFYNDSWNTVCLPFSVDTSMLTDIFGASTRVYEYSQCADGVMLFAPVSGTVAVGKPFIVWPEKEVQNPTFQNVVVYNSTTNNTVTIGGYSFCGNYAPHAMQTDGTEMFLNSRNTLSTPAAGKETLRGFRAYFKTPASSAKTAVFRTEDSTAGIRSVSQKTASSTATYNIMGQRVDGKLQRGIYIINGKKVLIR